MSRPPPPRAEIADFEETASDRGVDRQKRLDGLDAALISLLARRLARECLEVVAEGETT